nr:unnamed protein product [Callosobruchus analis]
MFSQKLDKKTAREWEERKVSATHKCTDDSSSGGSSESVDSAELPTLQEFFQFLRQKADILETIELKDQRSTKFDSRDSRQKGVHCFNCLNRGHNIKQCQSSGCRKCNYRHNTLLHYVKGRNKEKASDSTYRRAVAGNSEGVVHSASVTLSNSRCESNSTVFLQTALVQVFDGNGVPQICRALLDSASQSNLITSECCDRLGLPKENLPSAVLGVGKNVSHLEYRCRVQIKACNNEFNANLMCLVIQKISGVSPLHEIDSSSWSIPHNICLADPDFDKPAEIDLLIGGGLYLNLLCVGRITLGGGLPILQKTRLGWVVGGEMVTRGIGQTFQCNLTEMSNLHSQMVKFWEIEECGDKNPVLSEDDVQCEKIFSSTTSRSVDGKFVVEIPFKVNPDKALGDTRAVAVKRFYSLESRLSKNPSLKARYTAFMKEYCELGHMRKVDSIDLGEKSYYFPHHAVINENSPTTKLRVVFDGSCASDSGVSLNDLQYIGPTLQDDLIAVLLRFRQHKVVIGADIIKMYRQILVDSDQHRFQRIIWREDPTHEIDTYELSTVTYGTSSAPFLAVRCLKQLALECKTESPRASMVISRDFYMDDMLTGAESVEEAIQVCTEVVKVLESGGFHLQKWTSNNKQVLQHFVPSSSQTTITFGENERTKTLGLYWAGQGDHLMFNISDRCSNKVTKRSIPSEISQIFDPLGFLGPCVIISKIIMQRLWLYKIDWDESLPSDLDAKWRTFREQLKLLNLLKIPRIFVCEAYTRIEMHGFSDAALEAYGACIYLRSEDSMGNVTVRLVCSKTRVAPLKTITIPRLELCGALMLANLVKKVQTSLSVKIDKTYLWSDSTVYLTWIKTPPNILQTFVRNRVSQIQSLTNLEDWNHVRTADNPADLLSRGCYPKQLQECELWWRGPKWLVLPKDSWPKSVFKPEDKVPELKRCVNVFKLEEIQLFPYDRFSRFSKLVRVVAWCRRFIIRCRKEKIESSFLTADELCTSKITLVKMCQRESFIEEIQELEKTGMCKKGKLLKLNPFLDSENVLRVGGRIQLSECKYEKKHPALLCSKHPFTKLLFAEQHVSLFHAGPQLLLATIRETFWPLGGRSLARRTVHLCVRCFRSSPTQKTPIMGILPKERVSPAPPFTSVGVDYGGPFLIKDRMGRGCRKSKCYI